MKPLREELYLIIDCKCENCGEANIGSKAQLDTDILIFKRRVEQLKKEFCCEKYCYTVAKYPDKRSVCKNCKKIDEWVGI